MKTQIITLESHDDLISVRDRLSWAKTPRILLVWPKHEKITLRQVDLKVLQRHAASLGAQLGLVTRQRRVRADAEALGLPVFTSTGEAQKVAWPEIKRTRLQRKAPDKTLREKREQIQVREVAWRERPVVRISVFLLGVLSVLVLVALFIPRAQVQLNPVKQTQSILIPVSANPSVNSVFITGSIPAREKRIIVEGEQKILVTGEGIVPQSKAQGIVIFRNLTQGEITIPADTVVRSGDVLFVTTDEVVIEAGVGETAESEIEAVEGGIAGNLDAETIDTVDGRLSLSLSVTNPEPTEGGRERASVQATDSDRSRAKVLLLRILDDDARAGLEDELNSNDVLFDKSFMLSQIISENYDPPLGAAGSQLTLTMQVEYSIQYASASDLTELASLALTASRPPGFIPASEKVTFVSETDPTPLDDGSMRWTMRAEQELVQQVSSAYVTQLIQGLGSSAAQTRLEKNLPLLNKPKISLSPSWWPWMPIVPFRIEVVTQ
ncbi:MAG TPA: baseplate J/gp47 family protein [Anaerolineales bacterium]|nr:baseplate J/gp47 family protein [Anaerolineales bacterium]